MLSFRSPSLAPLRLSHTVLVFTTLAKAAQVFFLGSQLRRLRCYRVSPATWPLQRKKFPGVPLVPVRGARKRPVPGEEKLSGIPAGATLRNFCYAGRLAGENLCARACAELRPAAKENPPHLSVRGVCVDTQRYGVSASVLLQTSDFEACNVLSEEYVCSVVLCVNDNERFPVNV